MNQQKVTEALSTILDAGDIALDEPMATHTTFAIGGPAACFVQPRTFDQVSEVLSTCRALGVATRIIGLGSDLLVADKGLDCVVVQIADNLSNVEVHGLRIEAQAGASNAEVARIACDAGLAGYEFASGIPGTVGGAAIMNAGAYNGEFKDVAESLRCLTPQGVLVEVDAPHATWSYRQSMMDTAGYVVLSVTLCLRADDPAAIQERMDDLEQRRSEKQPLEMPSSGSTFKRPEGYFVGKLVQDAGLRGYRVGGAQVSEKHTGFVVNTGGATAEDVRGLIAEVQARVFEREGVQLEPEVRMWGFEQ